MKRAQLLLAAAALAACSRFTTNDAPVGKTAQPLIAESERLTGADLPDQHLILTFDDSPVSMAVTGAVSTFLAGRPTPIHATFFVDGSCVAATTLPNPICPTPTSDGVSVLAKLQSDGHLLGNHTTTARDLVKTVPPAQIVQELSETDAIISPYVPWNRKVFRPPNGSWIGTSADGGDPDAVYAALTETAMNAYVGPIAWNIQQSDVDCWTQSLTAAECGDLYRAEIHARGNGIVRFHDSLATVGLIQYLIPLLESDGYTFDDLDGSRALNALLPACDQTCADCTGPTATECTACASGQVLHGGACAACLSCPAGTFTSAACTGSIDTQCQPCEAGTYNASAGALSCATCVNCDDGNDCTTDQCSPTQGCTHTRTCVDDAGSGVQTPPPAATSTGDAGPPLDDEENVPADMSDSDSGCRSAPGRSELDGGLVIGVAVLVSVRRRRRRRSITL